MPKNSGKDPDSEVGNVTVVPMHHRFVGLSQVREWYENLPLRGRIAIKVLGVAGVCTVLGWFLAEFVQLRGIVHLPASRIMLVGVWACGSGLWWILFATVTSQKRRTFIRLLGVVLAAVVVVALDAWAPKPTPVPVPPPLPPIWGPFQSIYNSEFGKLGKPTGPIGGDTKHDDYAIYQASFESKMLIWDRGQEVSYVMPTRPGTTYDTIQGGELTAGEGFYTYEDIRKRLGFDPPRNLEFPFAGLAALWKNDPTEYASKIGAITPNPKNKDADHPGFDAVDGFPRWHVVFSSCQATFQTFENGIIIGPLRAGPPLPENRRDHYDGELFVFVGSPGSPRYYRKTPSTLKIKEPRIPARKDTHYWPESHECLDELKGR